VNKESYFLISPCESLQGFFQRLYLYAEADLTKKCTSIFSAEGTALRLKYSKVYMKEISFVLEGKDGALLGSVGISLQTDRVEKP
jgi:hypothetical protein